MPDKKTLLQVPGLGAVEAVEVKIKESTERWTEIQVADGTLIRIKPVVISVYRIEGQYDQDGNPVYQVKANQIMTAEAPDHLKKGAPISPGKPN